MRPRHKAAEIRHRLWQRPGHLLASMRPRHKAAEIARLGLTGDADVRTASMRPRHKAAEILPAGRLAVLYIIGFNEAAA